MARLAVLLTAVVVLALVLLGGFLVVFAKIKGTTEQKLVSVTRFLYITTQIAALVWVSVSYLIAMYATIALGQPFPVTELSDKAIDAILGVAGMKTLAGIFEHNNGFFFGTSDKSSASRRDSDDERTI